MVINIDAIELKKLMQNNEVLLIDVREESEYANGKIGDAILMPRSKIVNGDIVLDDILALNKDNKKIVFYCRSGARSNDVCKIFQKEKEDLDFYNLSGGILYFNSDGSSFVVGGCCPF